MSELGPDARHALRVAHRAHDPSAEQLQAVHTRVLDALASAPLDPSAGTGTVAAAAKGTVTLWKLVVTASLIVGGATTALLRARQAPTTTVAVSAPNTTTVESGAAAPLPGPTALFDAGVASRPKPSDAHAVAAVRPPTRRPRTRGRAVPARISEASLSSASVEQSDRTLSVAHTAELRTDDADARGPAPTTQSVAQQVPADRALSPPEARPAARGDSLAREIALLARAHQLMDGHERQALALLSEHARSYPSSVLREEVLATAVRCQCKLHDADSARAAFAQLLRFAPKSSHVSALRAVCAGMLDEM